MKITKQNNFFLSKDKKLKVYFLLIYIEFILFLNDIHYLFQKEKIIETNQYKNFNRIKNNPNSIFKEILNEITIIKHIYSNKIDIYLRNKNIMHLTVSLNNKENYKYILYVSMYSLLNSCNKNKTFIIYHILSTPDLSESSIDIIKTLVYKFPENVEMIFYNMGNSFMEFKEKTIYYGQVTYYRLLAPLFIDSTRILHLDGDTLVFSDLYEVYNLDFNDNYILGCYDLISGALDYLGLKSTIYINDGVILINLKKIRKENKMVEIFNMLKNNIKLQHYEQTIYNYVFFPKIGRLPSKYVIFNFEDKSDINVYLSLLRTKIPIEELEEGFKNPVIIHHILCFPKIWSFKSKYYRIYTNCSRRKNCSCKKYINLWHSIAKKTRYYKEISKFTGVKVN